MTAVMVLGPSEWDLGRGEPPFELTPMAIRRRVALQLRLQGIEPCLMEDEPDDRDEDILEKFKRLALTDTKEAIIVVWPPRAKMQTTFDELVLLREWRDNAPPVWILHHPAAARFDRGRIDIVEPGGRSRYLDAISSLGITGTGWRSLAELDAAVGVVATNLD